MGPTRAVLGCIVLLTACANRADVVADGSPPDVRPPDAPYAVGDPCPTPGFLDCLEHDSGWHTRALYCGPDYRVGEMACDCPQCDEAHGGCAGDCERDRCEGDSLRLCLPDRTWGELVACAFGCTTDRGDPCSMGWCNECVPGKTCQGDELASCSPEGYPAGTERCDAGCDQTLGPDGGAACRP